MVAKKNPLSLNQCHHGRFHKRVRTDVSQIIRAGELRETCYNERCVCEIKWVFSECICEFDNRKKFCNTIYKFVVGASNIGILQNSCYSGWLLCCILAHNYDTEVLLQW